MVIEKGVPLPPAKCHPREEVRRLLDQMVPGDSVLMEDEKQADVMRTAGTARGWTMAKRKIDKRGWRVWRVK